MSKLNFALVGCGRIAPKHVEALTSGAVPGARLAAVCDNQFERAEAIGKKHGIPYFADRFEMMDKIGDQIDVVSILTPSGLHAEHAIDMAKYRKHVVVEKPMALTLQDADRMISACDANGVRLFVVKQNRYNQPVKKLREAVEAGRFGKLVLGTVRVRWCRPQKYYDQDKWRGTWAYDGGVFANQASHHVDLLQWMMGEVESVFAKTSTALVNIETEDTGVVIVRFKNGALGVIEATTATRPKDLEGSISVLGEKGSVRIGGVAVNQIEHWVFDTPHEADAQIHDASYQTGSVYGFGHPLYYDNVIASMRGEALPETDGREGLKSLELLIAMYLSARDGKRISLPLAY